ncbi:hypothetical protein [Nonomuraea longispora]|uniref:hypothetical protein n=1 Tax=Nonomuraea longispora TaxID=1848320 RepID=UPI001404AB0A|nr:hypothetical protein [Nonomuraea longispora]
MKRFTVFRHRGRRIAPWWQEPTPARGVVLAAKALVVGPVMFAAGVSSGAVAAACVLEG